VFEARLADSQAIVFSWAAVGVATGAGSSDWNCVMAIYKIAGARNV